MTAIFIAIACVPASAQAQDRVGITLGAGGIFGADPPPAEDFVEPLVAVSVQRVMKRYFALDGELTYWAHTSRVDRGPHDINGPTGVIGHVTHSTEIDDRKYWNLGLNFLVKSTGRVRVFGGAGLGVVTQDTKYSQQDTGCSATTDPRICSPYVDARVRGPLPIARVLGGIEVPVNARMAIVGSVRAEAITWEGSTNFVGAVAGVRFSMR